MNSAFPSLAFATPSYILHHKKPRRKHYEWLIGRKWKAPIMVEFSRYFRLGRAMIFNKEWEADSYALVLLLQIGDVQSLRLFLDRHPDKLKWAFLAAFVSIFKTLPRLLTMLFRKLLTLVLIQ